MRRFLTTISHRWRHTTRDETEPVTSHEVIHFMRLPESNTSNPLREATLIGGQKSHLRMLLVFSFYNAISLRFRQMKRASRYIVAIRIISSRNLLETSKQIIIILLRFVYCFFILISILQITSFVSVHKVLNLQYLDHVWLIFHLSMPTFQNTVSSESWMNWWIVCRIYSA